jgi:hypothetical protein
VKKAELEQSLCRAINDAPALNFEKLLQEPVIKMTEDDYITRMTVPPARKMKPWHVRRLSAVMASIMVFFVCIGTWFVQFKTTDSTIALDADSGIVITTNKQQQILSVKAYSAQAQKALNEMNLTNEKLENSVNQIVTAMIEQGYLNEKSNVIMVSVENQNTAQASSLADSVDQAIKDSTTESSVAPTVVKQSVVNDTDSQSLADQYQVSVGKVNIMKEIAAADSSYNMESLAAMSVTELIQVSEEKNIDLSAIIKTDESDPNKTNDTRNDSQDVVVTPPDASIVETPDQTSDDGSIDDNDESQGSATAVDKNNSLPADEISADQEAGEEPINPPEGSENQTPEDDEVDDGGLTPPDGSENQMPDDGIEIAPPDGSQAVTPDDDINVTPPDGQIVEAPDIQEDLADHKDTLASAPEKPECPQAELEGPVPIKA